MNTPGFKLGRRALLKGAGIGVALPLLDAMMTDRGLLHGTARAQSATPVRLVTFFWANGPRGSRWAPTQVGALSAGTLNSCMSQAFAPAAGRPDIIPYLNVVTGLGAMDVWRSGHGCAMMACGYGTTDDHNDYGNWPTAASIDQLLADRFGSATRFPSLALSAPPTAWQTPPGWSYISWTAAARGIPPSRDPRQVFAQLFGTGAPAPAPTPAPGPTPPPQTPANNAVLRAAARRKSVLDFVKDDGQRLSGRLGASDRVRLDEHLGAIRAWERQFMTPAPTPMPPGMPTPAPLPVPATCGAQTMPTGENDVAMLKLIPMALACDQTRYVSFMLDVGSGQRSYPGSSGADHDLSHNAGDDVIIARTNAKLGYLANLLRDMAAVREGTGTLLDNSIVYSTSDVVDGRTHGREPSANEGSTGMPVVVAGRAGGRLRSGRHVRYDRRRLSDLMCSLLNYAGMPMDRYGSNGTGPLADF